MVWDFIENNPLHQLYFHITRPLQCLSSWDGYHQGMYYSKVQSPLERLLLKNRWAYKKEHTRSNFIRLAMSRCSVVLLHSGTDSMDLGWARWGLINNQHWLLLKRLGSFSFAESGELARIDISYLNKFVISSKCFFYTWGSLHYKGPEFQVPIKAIIHTDRQNPRAFPNLKYIIFTP